jgi:hypothetical protein
MWGMYLLMMGIFTGVVVVTSVVFSRKSHSHVAP